MGAGLRWNRKASLGGHSKREWDHGERGGAWLDVTSSGGGTTMGEAGLPWAVAVTEGRIKYSVQERNVPLNIFLFFSLLKDTIRFSCHFQI